MEPRALLTVIVEVDPAHEAEFNRWYDEQHLPEKLATDGFRSARRFRSATDAHRYIAVYELDDPQAALSPEYMSQTPSAWDREVQSHWSAMVRDVWVDATDAGWRGTQG